MAWTWILEDWVRGQREGVKDSPAGHDPALVVCLVRRLARRKDGRQLNIVMHSALYLTDKRDRKRWRADNDLEVLSCLITVGGPQAYVGRMAYGWPEFLTSRNEIESL